MIFDDERRTDRAGSKLNNQSLDAAKKSDRDDPGAGSISVFTEVFCIRYYNL